MYDTNSNRNFSKVLAIAFAGFVLISGFSMALSAGAAASDTDTSIVVHSETTIDNSTQSVYADVTGADDMNGSGPIAVDVTATGLTEGQDVANGTVLATETLSVSAGNVSSFSYALSDTETTDYDTVHVEVNVQTDGEEQHISGVDWGTLQEVSGGGGGFLDGGIGGVSIPVIGGVLVIGYFLMGRD